MDRSLALAVLRFSSGIYAGFGISVGVVSIQTLRKCDNRVEPWRALYTNGKKLALSTVFTSTVAGLYYYYVTNNIMALFSSLVLAFNVPFTLTVMDNTIKNLFKCDSKDGRINDWVETWNQHQYVRTTFGVVSFGLSIFLKD